MRVVSLAMGLWVLPSAEIFAHRTTAREIPKSIARNTEPQQRANLLCSRSNAA